MVIKKNKTFFTSLNKLNVIYNKNDIDDFINIYPKSNSIIKDFLIDIRNSFGNDKEIEIEQNKDNDDVLNICIRTNDYKDEIFFSTLSYFKNQALDLFEDFGFDILIYTDYIKECKKHLI